MEWPWARGGILDMLQELVWPCRCLHCGAGAPALLCACCVTLCQRHTGPRCRRCDDASPGPICPRCLRRERPGLKLTRGVWRYEGAIRQAVLAGKHGGHETIWAQLAKAMAQDEQAQALAHGAHLLVPIPLSTRRRWQRGYNPSALLAHALGQLWHRPVGHCLLRRAGARPPQSMLDAEARVTGMDNAFVAATSHPPLGGQVVLLVDDVITTGTTLHAASRVLRQLGAKNVYAVGVARQTAHQEGF